MELKIESFDGCFIDRPVHPFHLVVGRGIHGLDGPVIIAVFDHSGLYLHELSQLAHSSGQKMSTSLPIRFQRLLTVRSPILRSMALSLEKAFSIRLKSGL